MKRLSALLVLTAMFVFILAGCSASTEKLLEGDWYIKGRSEPTFTLFSDGTCEIGGEYGTGKWAIVNDDQFKVTTFYGESAVFDIKKISKDELIFSINGYMQAYYPEPVLE